MAGLTDRLAGVMNDPMFHLGVGLLSQNTGPGAIGRGLLSGAQQYQQAQQLQALQRMRDAQAAALSPDARRQRIMMEAEAKAEAAKKYPGIRPLIPFNQGNQYSFANPMTGEVVRSYPIAPTPTAQLTQGMRGGPEGVAPIPNWADIKASNAAQIKGAESMAAIPAKQAEAQIDVGAAYQKDLGKGQAEMVTQQGKQALSQQSVIDLLDPSVDDLIKSSTGSGVGAGVDALGRIVGLSTPGAQAAAQLKVLSGQLVSKMPRMEGPQSDHDVRLYQEMAGKIGDPTLPAEEKLAAISEVRRIARKYIDKQPGISLDFQRPLTPQELDMLPPEDRANIEGAMRRQKPKRWRINSKGEPELVE